MGRVEITTGPDDDPIYPVGARADRVAVHLSDGTVLESEEVERARGHGLNPMTTNELWQKFSACTAPQLGPDGSRAWFDLLQRIDAVKSTDEIPVMPPLD